MGELRRIDLEFSAWDTSRRISASVSGFDGAEQPVVAGRYRLDERVGSGAHGHVYRAWDTVLDRHVAIKTGAPRIIAEARALAQLRHPNAVILYDHGVDGDVGYLVMEMLNGQTLRQWRDSERRSLAEIIRVYIEAGRGLEAAHRAVVVHRDFKPDNVIVTRSGRVVVLDFGVATSGDQAEATSAGTLRYMAPEQIIQGGRVGPHSDQFAFCVALWEAITGAAPFASTDVRTRLESCITGPVGPEPVSAVGNLLRVGLSPSPASRWPSMGMLLSMLEQATRRTKRRPFLLAAMAAAGLVALGTIPLAPTLGEGMAKVSETCPAELGDQAVDAAEFGHVELALALVDAARHRARSEQDMVRVAELADEVGLALYRRSEWRASEQAHAVAHVLHIEVGEEVLALRSIALMQLAASADGLAQ